jgi:alpha-tubulin suppressor-like RCC1 family protein
MWGTDTKGSLLKPHDRRDESIVDVPQLIQDVPWKNRGGEEEGGALERVVCGASDTAFVLKDGTCYVVGENKYGQLGLGHKDPVSAPTPLKLPPPPGAKEDEATGSSRKIADVALGSSFAAVVDADGYLYTSGFGGSVVSGMGMLGHGTAESITSFRLVQSLVDDECRVRQVQVGESHMTVLTTEGEVSMIRCLWAGGVRGAWYCTVVGRRCARSSRGLFSLPCLRCARSSRAGRGATAASATLTRRTSCTSSPSRC